MSFNWKLLFHSDPNLSLLKTMHVCAHPPRPKRILLNIQHNGTFCLPQSIAESQSADRRLNMNKCIYWNGIMKSVEVCGLFVYLKYDPTLDFLLISIVVRYATTVWHPVKQPSFASSENCSCLVYPFYSTTLNVLSKLNFAKNFSCISMHQLSIF